MPCDEGIYLYKSLFFLLPPRIIAFKKIILHISYTFSTPDLILKEFVIWLCELVDDPHGKGEEKIPRIILYTSGEEKRSIDSLGSGSKSEKDQAQNNLFRSPATTMETSTNKPSSTFCIECGSKQKTI